MGDGPLVVFDGDDTLWLVEHLYDRARQNAGEIVALSGLDPVRWAASQRERDVRNVRSMGLSTKRFPTSCVQAYVALCEEAGSPVSPPVQDRIWNAASEVFHWEAEPIEAAREVLGVLAPSYRMVLLTQGESWVQERRVADSGLEPFFQSIRVVPAKTAGTFRRLLQNVSVPPERACSVGNSLASDINPALSCSMAAIWINAEVWEYERRETTPVAGRLEVAHDLRNVPGLLRQLFGSLIPI
jgi:putative hydrolase of the HAD superfamily